MLDILLIPLFSGLDRFWGSKWNPGIVIKGERQGKKLMTLLAAVLGGWLLSGEPWGAFAGLVWFAYRSPGWKVFGGSATPTKAKDIVETFLRHAVAMLALAASFWAGKPLLQSAIALGVYAAGATALAAAYGVYNKRAIAEGRSIEADDPFNVKLELARGALFGAALAVAL